MRLWGELVVFFFCSEALNNLGKVVASRVTPSPPEDAHLVGRRRCSLFLISSQLAARLELRQAQERHTDPKRLAVSIPVSLTSLQSTSQGAGGIYRGEVAGAGLSEHHLLLGCCCPVPTAAAPGHFPAGAVRCLPAVPALASPFIRTCKWSREVRKEVDMVRQQRMLLEYVWFKK